MTKQLSITPPEGVPIGFELAGLGARFGAQLVDILLTYGGLFLLFMGFAMVGIADFDFLLSLLFLGVFLIRTPYYILSELIWNGRTLGKRVARLRVISAQGSRLTPYQVAARNILKEAEVFMPIATLFTVSQTGGLERLLMFLWMVGVLFVPVFSRRNQRLGDMIAGTLVVQTPATVLLPDLAATPTQARTTYSFSREQLEIYGRFELQTLEAILRDMEKGAAKPETIAKICETIAHKIGHEDTLTEADHADFLTDFYRQQREFLEARHLFGDSRADKHHAKDS